MHFLLLQDDERDLHAGLATAPIVTKGGNPCVEYDKRDLRAHRFKGSDVFRSRVRARIEKQYLRWRSTSLKSIKPLKKFGDISS